MYASMELNIFTYNHINIGRSVTLFYRPTFQLAAKLIKSID